MFYSAQGEGFGDPKSNIRHRHQLFRPAAVSNNHFSEKSVTATFATDPHLLK
jgi:hypothetical protein